MQTISTLNLKCFVSKETKELKETKEADILIFYIVSSEATFQTEMHSDFVTCIKPFFNNINWI